MDEEENNNSCLGIFFQAIAGFVWVTFGIIIVVTYIILSPLILVGWIISKITGERF